MVLLHSWQIGDRVYCVSKPELTGTVVDVLRHCSLVIIQPDPGCTATPLKRAIQSADLEWYTRPDEGREGTI